jgi:long-chain fatty acid transport protein
VKEVKKKSVLSYSVATICMAVSGNACAAGMGLWEWGVPGVAVVSAGSAASGTTAASETANPAQATLFKHAQLSNGMVYIPVKINFTGVSKSTSTDYSVANNIVSRSNNLVPDLHYIQPMKKSWFFTFGISAPDGLNTNWKPGDWNTSGMQNVSTYSSVKVIDVNPGFAYRVNPHWSLALGANVLRGEANYNTSFANNNFTNDLKGTAYDWNAGVLYSPQPSTRIGLSYRSSYDLHAKGPSEFLGEKTQAHANMKFPSKLLFSVDQKVNAKWDALASVFHTSWGQLQNLTIINTSTGGGIVPSSTQIVDMHYKDTNLYSVGALYHYSKQLTLSAGIGRDISPVRDGYRDLRLPDTDRTDVGLGMAYQLDKNSGFNLSFQKVFARAAQVDDSARRPIQPQLPTVTGRAKTDASIFAFAYNRSFA